MHCRKIFVFLNSGELAMSRLKILEWSTILLLICDVSPKSATRDRLKFAFSRASWTSDIVSSAVAKRERRLETMLRHALRYSPSTSYALRRKLFEWDDERDSFAHGPRAREFLAKATVKLGATSPNDLRPLKRWVIAEFHRLDWW